MKLESLNSSKFDSLESKKFINLNAVVGGRIMSWHKDGMGGVDDRDDGDLTCCAGSGMHLYLGEPGDGIASDWTNVTWGHMVIEGEPPASDPPNPIGQYTLATIDAQFGTINFVP